MNINQTFLLCSVLYGITFGIATWFALKGLKAFRAAQKGQKFRKVGLPLFFKLVLPLVPLTLPLISSSVPPPALDKLKRRLVQGALDQTLTAEELYGIRLVHALVFVIVAVAFFSAGGLLNIAMGMIILAYGFFFPIYWLGAVIRKRHAAIQRALPNVLDLMTLFVEAGRDFLSALQDILKKRDMDPLGEELERVFREVQLGESRRRALRNMGERARQPDLSSVVEALVQADELGVSLGAILRILSDQMRQKRFFLAEKRAHEAPVKLLVPLILFIFPAVIIVMLGPILFHGLKNFM